MNPALYLALASLHITVVMIPGANFLRVTQNALAHSRLIGLITVAGVATGSGVYVMAGIIGFAAVVSQSPLVYDLIRIVGAAYFTYTGIRLLLRPPREADMSVSVPATPDLSKREAYRNGLLTCVSNPAAALYFLSVFTTFIPVASTLAEKLLAGVILVTITAAWYALVAVTFSDARVRRLFQRAERWMNRVFGMVWLLLAVKLLAG